MGGPAESTSLASKARGIGERFPLHQLRGGTVSLIQATAEGTASPPGCRAGVSQVGTDTEPLEIEGAATNLSVCSSHHCRGRRRMLNSWGISPWLTEATWHSCLQNGSWETSRRWGRPEHKARTCLSQQLLFKTSVGLVWGRILFNTWMAWQRSCDLRERVFGDLMGLSLSPSCYCMP